MTNFKFTCSAGFKCNIDLQQRGDILELITDLINENISFIMHSDGKNIIEYKENN